MNTERIKAKTIREKFSKWLNSPLGQAVLFEELEQVQEILPDMFGYHILQYGYSAKANYLTSSKIVNKIILFLDDIETSKQVDAIHTVAEQLPIAADSIDVIVLPHILEYSKDAHRLLREMDRVLIDDGHVIIIGINPFSLWGIAHLFLCWWNEMPWSGRLISITRLKDWLSLLDFEVEKTNYFFFSPPLRNQKLLKKFKPLERLGHYCWPIFGGLYVLSAKKRTVPLNPIKMKWTKKRQVIGSGVAEPTTRNSIEPNG